MTVRYSVLLLVQQASYSINYVKVTCCCARLVVWHQKCVANWGERGASLSNFTPMDLLNVTEDSSPCERQIVSGESRRCICEHECRAAEQPAARQARLDRQHVCNHERRAAEQPAARQARLDRQHVCNHECRAAEQPAARQG